MPRQTLRAQTRPNGHGDSVTVAASMVRNPWCTLDLAGRRPFSLRFGWAAKSERPQRLLATPHDRGGRVS